MSQEGDDVIVAFFSSGALEEFESRLASLASGKAVKYKTVLYALQSISGWSEEDRTGWALENEGIPEQEPFVLDVELWPLEERVDERARLWQSFEKWSQEIGIRTLDSVKTEGLSIFRIQCDRSQLDQLLHHRDVRTVDLPPRYTLGIDVLTTDVQSIPSPQHPPEGAPGVVVLDSGITTGHPLLGPAVGEAASFIDGKDPSDENGHGTLVAGLALFRDVETKVRNGDLNPHLWLFSGRILDADNSCEADFVENRVSKAVEYFVGEYGCRVFNLSIGDLNKPYLGKHIKGLAYTLDTLSRKHRVLFVVSTGNAIGSQLHGLEWRDRYPGYLTSEGWSIIDPAPALNVLTVGSLARYDSTTNSQRYLNDPSEVPIARRDQPSPFTRHGNSVGHAIKPDLVDYGGNWAVMTRAGANNLVANSGLGELSTNMDFVRGHPLADESGTSMAAPKVANLAATILAEIPDANPNLIRALLVCHAEIPTPSSDLIEEKDDRRRVCGYGMVDSRALIRSLEDETTLIANESISDGRNQFFELPVPDSFLTSGRRLRTITVALAYSPAVRSTRIAYRATRISFRLVAAGSLDQVVTTFNKATDREEYERIPELSTANVGPNARDKGTVQGATWEYRQFSRNSKLRNNRLFLVVTRNDFPWGENLSSSEEGYSLAVCFRDRDNERPLLYSQIQTRLQSRVRARVRV